MRLILSFALAAFAAASLIPSMAQAAWREAQTDHFVVYADDSERDLRAFAGKLERYHQAMEALTGLNLPDPSPSNRVSVYMVGSAYDLRVLYGDSSANVGGFYMPRAGHPAAFVPNIRGRGRELDYSMVVLLHEYAHHFLISNTTFPAPRWFNEGAADFFASASFGDDGEVTIGLPSRFRYMDMRMQANVRVEALLDPELLARRVGDTLDTFYAKSWALYHYLTFEPSRRGQMAAYLQAMARGISSREAAEQIFGDLSELEDEVQAYVRRPTMMSLEFTGGQLPIGAVEIRNLSEAESQAIELSMWSRRGVAPTRAQWVAEQMRPLGEEFPGDPFVQSSLAEAEYDAGNDQAAIAAANAALAADPMRVNAFLQKGYALMRIASHIGDDQQAKTDAYRAAAEPFLDLNAIENDHPLSLYFYYMSFSASGRKPSAGAKAALSRAVELAPFDGRLRMALVEMHLKADEFAAGRAALIPFAFNPHGGEFAEMAQQVIDRIDAGGLAEGEGARLFTLLTPEADLEADEAL